MTNSSAHREKTLPSIADPLALLEEGLRPVSASRFSEWIALNVDEVAAMLPAYEVRRLVGHGGMGAVYEAVQRDLQRRVAIKLLSPVLMERPGLAARFRYESRLMASLQHPGIVQVYEAGETAEGHLFYVMEFIDGEDLATRLHRERLAVGEAVELVSKVAEALSAAHEVGIIHRDVKPANILLANSGPPRLGDFGLALTAEQADDPLRLTRAGTTVGTVEYAAPEQLSHSHTVTAASDVYSLGVVAYEMLTGELPRGNFDPPSLRNPLVDPSFDGVLLRALQSDPLRRFANAGAFQTAFLHAADRRQQQAIRDREIRQKMLRRAWITAALAAVALFTAGSAFIAWRARIEAEKRRTAAESAERRMTDLFQFLLTDLRKRLEPTGNLGAMESVLDKAVDHFQQEYEAANRSPESSLKLADVLVIKGDVIGVRGLRSEADALYTQAISLVQSAHDAAPEDATRAYRLVQAYQDRSEHRQANGQYEKAHEDALLMLSEATKLSQRHPSNRASLAIAAAHRASAHSLGYTKQLEAARREYLEAQRILSELSIASPQDKTVASQLADMDMALGSNAEALGDFTMMLKHFTAWHDHVKQSYGIDSNMYSHAAFRMGVALYKLKRSEEALPFLSEAVRIAERDAAEQPGHKGLLNHVSWCVRLLAQVHEALGHTEQAATYRRRQAEVTTELGAKPKDQEAIPRATLESDFEQLLKDTTARRAQWWAFCQRLQQRAETLGQTNAFSTFFEEWLKRATDSTAQTENGAFARIVPAFLHNRLATLHLRKDPVRSGEHARRALTLREEVAQAHPEEPELQWDVLSSACHSAMADLSLETGEASEVAFRKIATIVESLSATAFENTKHRLFFAERIASLLEYALSRWPERKATLGQTGARVAAKLLEEPQPKGSEESVKALRLRLCDPKPTLVRK